LAKKAPGTLTAEQKDLQGALAVEIESLKKQLAHFKTHKRQMKNQRAYIRKCEKELEPRGQPLTLFVLNLWQCLGRSMSALFGKTLCRSTPFTGRRFYHYMLRECSLSLPGE
jgi:hypothetical protein